jgi:hypothetical protein
MDRRSFLEEVRDRARMLAKRLADLLPKREARLTVAQSARIALPI